MNDIELKQFLEYQDEKKSLAVAYVLWAAVGPFGGHRFYLGRTGSAVAMLVLTLSLVGFIVAFIWWIVDAVLIPGIVQELNRELLEDIMA